MTAPNMLDGATTEDELISTLIDQWYFHSDIHVKAKLLRFARELLSASKPVVAKGWKLVPVDLTERMRDEADFAMQNHAGDDYSESDSFDGWFQPVWAAMLAACPAAPAQPFEAWAMQEGLISESHGVRFVNSVCDVAQKAWNAALAASPAAPARSANTLTRELLDTLQMVVKHFTQTPSTLADSQARGKAHEVIAKAYAQIGYAEASEGEPAQSGESVACELCNGIGKSGIPGQRCFNCDGSGKSPHQGLSAAPRPAQTFEQWASDPVRADKIPLAMHPNGAYADTRSYLIYYGWKSALKHGVAQPAQTAQSKPVDDSWIDGVAIELWKTADVSGFEDFKLAVSGFLRATAQSAAAQTEPVAVVESWTNGSYHRNYRLRWLKDVPEGTPLYAARPAQTERVLTDDAQDAARWRAFVNCARVRLFGWAGYGSTKGGRTVDADPRHYRHFGAEFWTIYDAPSDSMAKEILTGFADAAVAIETAQPASGGGHE